MLLILPVHHQGLPARSALKTTQGLPARSSVKTGHWPVFRALLTHRIIFRACLTPSQPFPGLPARSSLKMVHRTIFRALRTPCSFSCVIRSNPRFAMVFSASLTLKTPCSPGLHRPSSPTGRGRFRPPGGKAARTCFPDGKPFPGPAGPFVGENSPPDCFPGPPHPNGKAAGIRLHARVCPLALPSLFFTHFVRFKSPFGCLRHPADEPPDFHLNRTPFVHWLRRTLSTGFVTLYY